MNPSKPGHRRILWDCSYLDREPWRASGIQRVVRELGNAVIEQAARRGIEVAIVSLPEEGQSSPPLWRLKAIPSITDRPLGLSRLSLDPGPDDILVVADSTWHLGIGYRLAPWWERGMTVVVVQYDVVPLSHPETTDAGQVRNFSLWMLEVATFADAIIAVSQTTSAKTLALLARLAPWRNFHSDRVPTCRLSGDHGRQAKPYPGNGKSGPVLALGTIEPRKNYPVMLDAFEAHWKMGGSIPLLVVGRYGWQAEEIAARIESLQSSGKPLQWLQDASDRDLWDALVNSRAFISMSVEEGFDLPCVEAGVNGIPLILSDIQVHREMFDNYARFVSPTDPSMLAELLDEIELSGIENPPEQPSVLSRSWQDSADELLGILGAVTPDPDVRSSWMSRLPEQDRPNPNTLDRGTVPMLRKRLAEFAGSINRNSTIGKLARFLASLAKVHEIRQAVFDVARRSDQLEHLVGHLESVTTEAQLELSVLHNRQSELEEMVKSLDALTWHMFTQTTGYEASKRVGGNQLGVSAEQAKTGEEKD